MSKPRTSAPAKARPAPSFQPAERTKTLFIAEQSALDVGGHYYAYSRCVAQAALQQGMNVTILQNKRFSGNWQVEGAKSIPAFHHTWGEAEKLWIHQWEPGNIAFDYHEAVSSNPPQRGDHVLFATLAYAELRAFLEYLNNLPVTQDLPTFHLLLRYDPEVLRNEVSIFRPLYERMRSSALLRDHVRFHTDTDLLSAEFAQLTGVPFTTLPIPFKQEHLIQQLAVKKPDASPLTITYLGDARLEKNYSHIPDAVAYLWEQYGRTGRVRFVLQSNFNTPGGETGVLQAVQRLGQYPSRAVRLITESMSSDDYYETLAQSDIVIIPYDPNRYRSRSSGVLIEAIAAGKPVVTTKGSWMETIVTSDHAVVFDAGKDLGPALKTVIDNFPRYKKAAEALAPKMLDQSSGRTFVRSLVATAMPTAPLTDDRPRIAFIVDGDVFVTRNGAGAVAFSRLQYLQDSGYRICAIFVMNKQDWRIERIEDWTEQLRQRIAGFKLEGTFLVGSGRLSFDTLRQKTLRKREPFSIAGDLERAQAFDVSLDLVSYLSHQRVDAVWLNYITNYPLIPMLGFDKVPVICETYDIQSFQKAIYGGRPVTATDIQVELKLLGQCDHLFSISAFETEYLQEALPNTSITTTGMYFPICPPTAGDLAGCKSLGEVVSSCLPEQTRYRWEEAWEMGQPEAVLRLTDLQSIDLIFVSSNHLANVSGLKWFLDEVYLPLLAPKGISMVVVGSISEMSDWPSHDKLFFIGRVEHLTPLYAAARIVLLPVLEGAGIAVKTAEALSLGRPIVATQMAVRGMEGNTDGIEIADTPQSFAFVVNRLLASQELRFEQGRAALQTARKLTDPAIYAKLVNDVFQRLLGDRAIALDRRPSDPAGASLVEWSPLLQRLNRLIRGWLENDLFEAASLEIISTFPEDQVSRALADIIDALVTNKTAFCIRSEKRVSQNLVRFGAGDAPSAFGCIMAARSMYLPVPETRPDSVYVVFSAAAPFAVSVWKDRSGKNTAEPAMEARGQRHIFQFANASGRSFLNFPARPSRACDVASVKIFTHSLETFLATQFFSAKFLGENHTNPRVKLTSHSRIAITAGETINFRLPFFFSPTAKTQWLDLMVEDTAGLKLNVIIEGVQSGSWRVGPSPQSLLRFGVPYFSPAPLYLNVSITATAGVGAIDWIRSTLVFGNEAPLLLEPVFVTDVLGLPDEPKLDHVAAGIDQKQHLGQSLLSLIKSDLALPPHAIASLRAALGPKGKRLRTAVDAVVSAASPELQSPTLAADVAAVLDPMTVVRPRGDSTLRIAASPALTLDIEAMFSAGTDAGRVNLLLDGEPINQTTASGPLGRWTKPGTRDANGTGWLRAISFKSTLEGEPPQPESVVAICHIQAAFDPATGGKAISLVNAYRAEPVGEAPVFFWTGLRRDVSVILPIGLTWPGVISVGIINLGRVLHVDELALFVNGRRVNAQLEGTGEWTLVAPFDADPDVTGIAEITVQVETFYGVAGEKRRLGIAISSIELRMALALSPQSDPAERLGSMEDDDLILDVNDSLLALQENE